MAGARVSPILAVTCSGTGRCRPGITAACLFCGAARRLRQLSEAKLMSR
jgi:hypothetical protein